MAVTLRVAGKGRSSVAKRRKKSGSDSLDLVGEGRSLLKTLTKEIGLPAALALIAVSISSVWTERDKTTGKYGPMFALTAVGLAWGVPKFILKSVRLLDAATARRAGAIALGMAVSWDTVIAPVLVNNQDHIITKIVRWAQELVARDPGQVAAANQAAPRVDPNNYGGAAEQSFAVQRPAAAASNTSSSSANTTAAYIAAGGQALGAVLEGIGSLAQGFNFGGSSGAGDVGGSTTGMGGPSLYARLGRMA